MPLPPTSITLDELDVWNEIAPAAFEKGTLTKHEVWALRDLCQLRVLKDKLLRKADDLGPLLPGAGGTVVANPLLARITTLSQRIEAGMVRFQLSPIGKAIDVPKEPEKDPFAEFDSDPASAGDGETIN